MWWLFKASIHNSLAADDIGKGNHNVAQLVSVGALKNVSRYVANLNQILGKAATGRDNVFSWCFGGWGRWVQMDKSDLPDEGSGPGCSRFHGSCFSGELPVSLWRPGTVGSVCTPQLF